MERKQDNGNVQLNSIRNEFNDRTSSMSYLGQANRITWNNKRRYRTI